MTFLPRQQILTLEELRDAATAFVNLGIRKIRLTEVSLLSGAIFLSWLNPWRVLTGLMNLPMTTNGVKLPSIALEASKMSVSLG